MSLTLPSRRTSKTPTSGSFGACQLYVFSWEILLRPTWSHGAFVNTALRIFMSTTLGTGDDLERLAGRSDIDRPPIAEG